MATDIDISRYISPEVREEEIARNRLDSSPDTSRPGEYNRIVNNYVQAAEPRDNYGTTYGPFPDPNQGNVDPGSIIREGEGMIQRGMRPREEGMRMMDPGAVVRPGELGALSGMVTDGPGELLEPEGPDIDIGLIEELERMSAERQEKERKRQHDYNLDMWRPGGILDRGDPPFHGIYSGPAPYPPEQLKEMERLEAEREKEFRDKYEREYQRNRLLEEERRRQEEPIQPSPALRKSPFII